MASKGNRRGMKNKSKAKRQRRQAQTIKRARQAQKSYQAQMRSQHSSGASVASHGESQPGDTINNNIRDIHRLFLPSIQVSTPILTQKPSTFLTLPREIRDQVYKELLSVSQWSEWGKEYYNEGRKNFPGLNLLGVNQQIRSEAWDMLVTGNAWIQIRICGPAPWSSPLLRYTIAPGRFSQPYFKTDNYSTERERQLRESSVITICLGTEQNAMRRKDKIIDSDFDGGLVLLLAYHPDSWVLLVNLLILQLRECHSMHIAFRDNIHQHTGISGRALKEIMTSMFMIRSSARVSASGGGNEMRNLVLSISQPLRSDAELLDILFRFRRIGNEYREAGDLYGAMRYYGYILEASISVLPWTFVGVRSAEGSPMHNTLKETKMQLFTYWAYTANVLMIRLQKDKKSQRIPGILPHKSTIAASAFLEWAGATDQQRRHAHWRRGQALELTADLDGESLERMKFELGINRDTCYSMAARDYWYALQIDGEGHNHLERLYVKLCRKISRDPGLPFPLKTVYIPALGMWTGDPDILLRLGPYARWMRRLRQRISPLLGEAMGEGALRALYARDGIHW
ncbi:hypothetical protein G7054_g467 [Neopestalotiopsis clavispora]|nr:hypothetical protein G7054_g467 [Neopestalotiopsis clavispora]